jgi:hypothetical protein
MTLFPWFGDGESKSPTMERMSEVNELPSSLNLAFLESLYEVYLRDSANHCDPHSKPPHKKEE